jgi:hypothetical protein
MHALGRQIVEQQIPDVNRAGGAISIPLEDPANKR